MKYKKRKKQIIELRNQGKSYSQIEKILGCSRSIISFHCGQGKKEKNLKRVQKNRLKQHPYLRKLETFEAAKIRNHNKNAKTSSLQLIYHKIIDFHMNKITKQRDNISFTIEDIIQKFTEKPTCYLTGELIDIYNPKSYQFDHIIPSSKGGLNTLDNLGICIKNANIAKNSMMLDEFILLCEKILKHNGYKVKRPGNEPVD